MEPRTYDKIMSANVRSHWLLLKYCDPYLVKGSSVVLISSVAAHSPSFPLSVYGVSKTALVSLGKSLSSEYGPKGIRINTICPGVVRTKLSEMLWKSSPTPTGSTANHLQR